MPFAWPPALTPLAGVLTVLNNEIQSARDVTKSNAFRVETFTSRELGFLGYVDSDGQDASTGRSRVCTPLGPL